MFLDLHPSDFWQPLFLEVPLMARGSRWLRFDLVTDGGESANPVCSGMLFPAHVRDLRRDHYHAQDITDVLALSRLHNDGATPVDAGRTLEEVSQTCPPWQVTPRKSTVAHDLSILRIDELAGLEVLYFVGWGSLGRALVSARLPTSRLSSASAPVALALPQAGWSTPGGRILGYGAGSGLVTLSW